MRRKDGLDLKERIALYRLGRLGVSRQRVHEMTRTEARAALSAAFKSPSPKPADHDDDELPIDGDETDENPHADPTKNAEPLADRSRRIRLAGPAHDGRETRVEIVDDDTRDPGESIELTERPHASLNAQETLLLKAGYGDVAYQRALVRSTR